MAGAAQSEQRRALLIAAIGFGLVLLLFVGSRLLGGGGGDGGGATTPSTRPPGTPVTTGPRAQAPDAPLPPLPDTFQIAELRDPFLSPLQAQLTPPPLPPPGGARGATTTTGGVAPVPVSRVELLDVFRDTGGATKANVRVDGTVYKVGAGQSFGVKGEFQVVSLDGSSGCGDFLRGDVRFRLCVGQVKLK